MKKKEREAMLNTRKLLCRLAAMSLAACLFAGTAAAEPGWEQVDAQLRATQLPAEQVATLLAQAQARNVPPAQVAQWAATMARLHAADVPPALAGERLAQGLVKNVPVERLNQALATLENNLAWASQVVGARAPRADIHGKPAQAEQALRSMETALRADFTRPQIERMLGREPLALAQIAALTRAAANLRSFGAEPDAVVRALQRAGSAGMGAAEVEGLERNFAAGIAAGRTPRQLVSELARSVDTFRGGPRTMDIPSEMRREMQHDMKQEFQSPAVRDQGGMHSSPGGAGGWQR